jgi:addiction module HigA family antidote
MSVKRELPLVHPGEILREEFLKPLHKSVNQFAKQLDVPAQRINEIVRERRGITADTALRLSRLLGTTPEFWMNLQTFYDLRKAANENGAAIEKNVHALLETDRAEIVLP